MRKGNIEPKDCEEDVAAKLKRLQTMVSSARELEAGIEGLVAVLGEQSVDSGAYQVAPSLAKNLTSLREILADSYDFHFREFIITSINRKAAVVFLEGMANEVLINTHIIERLMLQSATGQTVYTPQAEYESIKDTLLTVGALNVVNIMEKAVKQLLSGDTLLLVEGVPSIIIIESRKMEARPISEPETESNVRAPRDGFVEVLETNISLLRRRLKSNNLIAKRFTLGVRSNTNIDVVYFRGIVNPRLVCEVERRLRKIKIDLPISTGFLEGLLEDHPKSIFPTMLVTERPDKVAAALVEGKVAILMDGSPFVLLAPSTFSDFFQTSDDYNEKWLVTSIIRFTRYFSALFAMATPAVFVAITTFHPGLLPTPLAITIAVARMNTPFPAFLEALFMIALVEILQEAGLRLPKTIGPAVSIFGGLVIGEGIVRAELISAPMIIVIAFTAIASFNIANYRINLIVRLLRVPLLSLGASLGLFGVMMGLLTLFVHLSLLESFGVPFLAPVTPRNLKYFSDLKDTVVVAPPSAMDERPEYLNPEDSQRQQN